MTGKQRLFALEYLIDLNKTQAAVRAGFSKKTAHTAGNRLFKIVEVQAFIQEQLDARTQRTKITADRILGELARLALVDPLCVFDDDGSVKDLKDIPEDARRAITSIEIIEYFEGYGQEREQVGVIKKIKMASKEKCLDLLARHLKLLTEKIELGADDELAKIILESFDRKEGK